MGDLGRLGEDAAQGRADLLGQPCDVFSCRLLHVVVDPWP
jgi:hypothetical protein